MWVINYKLTKNQIIVDTCKGENMAKIVSFVYVMIILLSVYLVITNVDGESSLFFKIIYFIPL
jgi:hypothetical protein